MDEGGDPIGSLALSVPTYHLPPTDPRPTVQGQAFNFVPVSVLKSILIIPTGNPHGSQHFKADNMKCVRGINFITTILKPMASKQYDVKLLIIVVARSLQ
jgi:hypothetical protein